MVVCPSNDSECLLRALVDAQSAYNWDPLTFAFTVAIGVLAFVVALITVFQGALAAGPGRLKASHAAIGEFSKFSSSHLSLTEFRVRTYAHVPYLDEPQWIQSRDRLKLKDWTPRYVRSFGEKPLPSGIVPIMHSESISPTLRAEPAYEHFGGGWVTLLSEFPQGPRFFGSQPDEPNNLFPSATDYLPSEIVAAPAVGTIETILTLAAFGGCDDIRMVDGYPYARGNNTQLSFRDHPMLGMTAVFQRFPGLPTYQYHSDLATLFRWSRLEELDTVFPQLETTRNSFTAEILLQYPVDWPRAIPISDLAIWDTARLLCSMSEAWSHLDKPAIVWGLKKHCNSNSAGIYWHLPCSGFEKQLRKYHQRYASDRSIDTSSDMKDIGVFEHPDPGIFFAHSWTRIWTDYFAKHTPAPNHCIHGQDDLYPIPDGPISLRELIVAHLGDSKYQVHVKKDDRALILLPLALSSCLSWLRDPDFFKSIDLSDKCYVRGALRYQLHEVDYFLNTVEETINEARFESFKFCEAVSRLPKEHDQNGDQHGLKADTDKSLPDDKVPIEEAGKGMTASEGLKVLLVYRAVLAGALFSTAADTSSVAGTELGRRVVHFL